jgi:hypothetical protein
MAVSLVNADKQNKIICANRYLTLPVLKYLPKEKNNNTPNSPIRISPLAGIQETAELKRGCMANNRTKRKAFVFFICKKRRKKYNETTVSK